MFRKVIFGCAKFLAAAVLVCGGALCFAGQDSQNEFWKDDATGLTWTARDNGANVSFTQAGEYCSSLRLGGHSDWHLPTIDELEALYDSRSSKQYKIKGPIELSNGSVFSGSTNNSGEVWSFYFTYGGRSLGRASGHGNNGRTLCVR